MENQPAFEYRITEDRARSSANGEGRSVAGRRGRRAFHDSEHHRRGFGRGTGARCLAALVVAALSAGCNMDTPTDPGDAAGGSSAAGGSKVSSESTSAGGSRTPNGTTRDTNSAGEGAARGGGAPTDDEPTPAGDGEADASSPAGGHRDAGAGGSRAPNVDSGTAGHGEATAGHSNSGGRGTGGSRITDAGAADRHHAEDSGQPSADSSPNPSPGACGERPSGSILPFVTGYRWTYTVTDAEDGTTTEKTTEVQGTEPVGYGDAKDLVVHRVLTTKKSGTDKTVSWQEVLGDSVMRYREDAYSKKDGSLTETDFWTPYRLHADGSPAHTVAGAEWADTYQETKMPVGEAVEGPTQTTDKWTVASDYDCIDVPAGTGPNGPMAAGRYAAVKFDKVTPKGKTKSYWYVRGIGKIREVGSEQTEQLIGFSLTAQ
jgi:hypothetical protein